MAEVGTKRKVNIVHLKQFATEELPLGCALRQVLLVERDELLVEEFVMKMNLWFRLLSLEGTRVM